jgi:hypothetical protein
MNAPVSIKLEAIGAELKGGETALACGLVVRSGSPLIVLCRQLVAAGHDPATPLEAYRGSTLCLIVRSIGEAADLEVSAKGIGFIKRHRRRCGEASYSDLNSAGVPDPGVASKIDSARPD